MISKNTLQTMKFAAKVASEVKNGGLVLLYGDLGSGKTTFVKGMAKELGIKELSIKSPTYSYIRHLPTNSSNFYHIDLYRIEGKDQSLQQEINELIQKENNIVIIEWADKMEYFPAIEGSIKIHFKYSGENSRELTFKRSNRYLTNEQIKEIYKKFSVPKNIIAHMNVVAQFAEKLCDTGLENGLLIDKKAVVNAALIHDTFRVCDIRNFDPNEISKNPSKKTIETWTTLRKKYSKIGHEKAMANHLKEHGYAYIANLIAKHGFFEVKNLKTLEEKILYYSDKRAEHDTIVPLGKRFSEGRKRNFNSETNADLLKKTEDSVYKLEKELSKLLGQNIDKL